MWEHSLFQKASTMGNLGQLAHVLNEQLRLSKFRFLLIARQESTVCLPFT